MRVEGSGTNGSQLPEKSRDLGRIGHFGCQPDYTLRLPLAGHFVALSPWSEQHCPGPPVRRPWPSRSDTPQVTYLGAPSPGGQQQMLKRTMAILATGAIGALAFAPSAGAIDEPEARSLRRRRVRHRPGAHAPRPGPRRLDHQRGHHLHARGQGRRRRAAARRHPAPRCRARPPPPAGPATNEVVRRRHRPGRAHRRRHLAGRGRPGLRRDHRHRQRRADRGHLRLR